MSSIPQPTPVKRRIVSIQVCRGLAALIVVFAHLHNVEQKYFTTNFLGLAQFGVLGVDLFFVISGVVISAVTAGKFASAPNAATFLYHRFARIYPIFWVYTAVVLAAFLYNPNWINAGSGHRVNILQSFLLIPSPRPMLIMQGWTLSFEIYFYLIFTVFLLFLPERLAPVALALWGAVVVALALFAPQPTHGVTKLLSSPLILEFLAGCALFHLYRRSRLHPRAGVLLIAASLLWITGVILATHVFHHADQSWIEDSRSLRPALYGTFAVFFLFGAMELERSNLIRFTRPFAALGDWSYSIYLSHIILVELFGRAVFRFVPHLPGAILLIVALSLPTIILAGYLSYTFLELPLLALLYKRPDTRQRLPN